jgi:hypothetical protein
MNEGVAGKAILVLTATPSPEHNDRAKRRKNEKRLHRLWKGISLYER